MFERFTDRSRRVLVLAQEKTRLLNHSFIGTEHILLGLIDEREGVAALSLAELGITRDAVQKKVVETLHEPTGLAGTAPTSNPPFTPRAKKVLELSLREALQLGHSWIGTEHILLGLVREGEGVAAQVLVGLGAELPRVRQAVIAKLSRYQKQEPAVPPRGMFKTPTTKVDIRFKGTSDLAEGVAKAAIDCDLKPSAWLRTVVSNAVRMHEKLETFDADVLEKLMELDEKWRTVPPPTWAALNELDRRLSELETRLATQPDDGPMKDEK